MAVDFTIAADVFAGLVAKIDKVVERRNTIPILSNVHVQAEVDGTLLIKGTDLDLEMHTTTEIAAEVQTAGATTVPQKLLADILRKLGKNQVRFKADETNATVSAGRSSFKLLTLPDADYPEIKGVHDKDAVEFALPKARLRRILNDCGFAISSEETRYYLNGVFLHAVDGRLVSVATDGHRLAKLEQEAIGSIGEMPGVIVPTKAVRLFKEMTDWTPEGEDIAIRVDTSKIEFSATGFRLLSKLIDGTFPDYQRVIPTGNPNRMMVDPEAMQGAVDRVATVSSERGRAVKLTLADGTMTLTVQSPDAGIGTDEIAVEMAQPFDLELGFNAKYVNDALGTFPFARVEFALGEPGSPAVIRNPNDEHRLVVLMPMRV
ncbi:DNA polymerase III subunit beta [Aureimonas sp. AU40]|uniref:DNA polymerase III subunit beta n=1 Tax=Aureimonas sp. AU40 TaxID=1637747 RepID=UPI00078070D3|nr:DNA polymerase III subunit beta [Aureimonas sp. AU40]